MVILSSTYWGVTTPRDAGDGSLRMSAATANPCPDLVLTRTHRTTRELLEDLVSLNTLRGRVVAVEATGTTPWMTQLTTAVFGALLPIPTHVVRTYLAGAEAHSDGAVLACAQTRYNPYYRWGIVDIDTALAVGLATIAARLSGEAVEEDHELPPEGLAAIKRIPLPTPASP